MISNIGEQYKVMNILIRFNTEFAHNPELLDGFD